jgi:hypothetical protein
MLLIHQMACEVAKLVTARALHFVEVKRSILVGGCWVDGSESSQLNLQVGNCITSF